MDALVTISRELAAHVDALRFPSVTVVYNPLVYARVPHEAYVARYGAKRPREVLMVGMNPGPFVSSASSRIMISYDGLVWEDRAVVVDGNLISSRTPADLPEFCRAIIAALSGERGAP